MDLEELARRAAAAESAGSALNPKQLAERARMIAIAEDRMKNGAEVESTTPGAGMVLDPRTGTYKNRRALTEGYEPTRAEAVVGGGMQGLGLNFGDEVVGGIGRAVEGPGMGDLRREQMRGRLEKQQQAFPYTYGASEIGGNVATAAAALPAATAPTMLGTMGRGAGLGAIEGAAYGAGQGEGAADRANQAMNYGMVGGALGGVAPPVIAAGTRAGRAVLDAASGGIDTVINRGSNTRARQAVLDALQRSGRSADDVAQDMSSAAASGQPEYRLMDAMGVAGQRRASGVARQGGEGAEEIAQFLQQRQLDQPDRVGRFVDEAFDMGGRTADETATGLRQARSQTANAAYDAARANAGPVDVRSALSVIDDRIGGMQGSGVAGDSIDGRLAGFRSRLAAQPGPDGANRELSDFDRVLGVKQDVQDAIGAATRAGRNNEARELGKLSRELDQALESASPDYRAANDQFAAASRTIEAVDEGAKMSRPSQRAQDNVGRFQNMTPEQQAAARAGYGDRALARVEAGTSPTANRAKQFTSTKAATEADAMAVDPATFRDRIARENAMWETQNRALGGSRTADNLEDIRDIGPLRNVARALQSAGNLQFGQAAADVGNAVAPALTGNNEATRKIVAQILMSDDPAKALAPILRQQQSTQARRRILEALARSAGRDPAYSAMMPR